ncbi:MAG: PQQ-binding-like beta-propeller repeat protein, partial [Pirellulaceae bacterium]|nr:PQQ-binding-like beta-propeller repeat protein [Pirellulaceae bacterium]
MTKYHSLQSIVNFRVGIGFTPLLFIALFVGVSGCGQQVAEQARQQAEAALEEARAAEAGAEQLRQELEELKKNSEEQAETNQETAEAEPDGSKRSPKTEPGTESEPAPKEESATPKAASAVAADDVEPVGAVDDEDLLTAQDNNANWLMYGRTYNSQRYSGLDQINKDNVSDLLPVWTFQTGVLDGFECTPLVVDGIMYITTPWNHAYAIDCKTGSQLWHYQKSLPENMALCCDAVNRGFAVYGENLYMSTLDAHLVCLDKNTGEEIWDTAITAYNENGEEEQDIYKMAYSATVAPLVIKGKVIIGISGAEYGIRGFIDAYNAETGERQWRFYTVPAEDDEAEHAKEALKSWGESSWLTGGGSAWVTGTYDAELNTLYWGIGNPSPDFN